MDEYLQYMKTLRSQMNDVEDQAAKISFEEQMQITTTETLEKDLAAAKAELQKVEGERMQLMEAKGRICSEILEKQRKLASLESDSCTLAQTLELIQHERASISAKLLEKSNYYKNVAELMDTKLQHLQDWLDGRRPPTDQGEDILNQS